MHTIENASLTTLGVKRNKVCRLSLCDLDVVKINWYIAIFLPIRKSIQCCKKKKNVVGDHGPIDNYISMQWSFIFFFSFRLKTHLWVWNQHDISNCNKWKLCCCNWGITHCIVHINNIKRVIETSTIISIT